MDIYKEEANNGIRFTWNVFPNSKIDQTRIVVPVGFHYSPTKRIENLTTVNYEPVLCKNCKSILNPYCNVDFRSKCWECPFCSTKNLFPTSYSQHISEQTLPPELLPEATSIEYILERKRFNPPTFLFVIDTAVDQDELNELKDSIQQTLSGLPPDCSVGIITFGTMCQVHEIGFTECTKMYVFRGDKGYTPQQIQEQLGLISKTDPRGGVNSKRFILPYKDCELTINSFLDDLQVDSWPKQIGERSGLCSGLALNIAISLLEYLAFGEPTRIMFFLGGAATIGQGQVVGKQLSETIRNFIDFDKKNSNTNYFKTSVQFYQQLAERSNKASQIIDIFSCSLNQVGLLEMKCCTEKTGGYMVLTDSFSTVLFKDSFKKMFELDENNNLKMNFKGKLELFLAPPLKVAGAIGHLASLNVPGSIISDTPIGEGNTRSWLLGGIDSNSTYSFILDVTNPTQNSLYKKGIIQLNTWYVMSDGTTRLRVTSCLRKFNTDSNNLLEIAQNFDQEAAAVMMARYCVIKGYVEESIEVLRWLDKSLIRLITKFAEYKKDEPRSFRLSREFTFFPQFIFYLRRSHFLQNFNASPDEIVYYKSILLHENVTNSTIMIQPILLSYAPDKPEPTPVLLDYDSMKNDVVLCLDTYFYIIIWHGTDVCKWRDAGYHYEPEYENIKNMIDLPQEYAQSLVNDRLPVSRFLSCDYGAPQERLIRSVLNPTNVTNFDSDDVNLKVFMEHLVKLAVQS